MSNFNKRLDFSFELLDRASRSHILHFKSELFNRYIHFFVASLVNFGTGSRPNRLFEKQVAYLDSEKVLTFFELLI